MSLERPAFDYNFWIPRQFGPSWQRARSQLPPLTGEVASGLAMSISDPTLQDLLTRLRELLEFILIITRDPSLADVLSWPLLSSTSSCFQARLIDHYPDQISLVKSHDDTRHQPLDKVRLTIAAQASAWVSAYMALAGLQWMRVFSRMDNIPVGLTSTQPVSSIYEAGSTILAAMKHALTASENSYDLKHDQSRL
jgi:hypothetical protein